ncbi:biliverdin-producing heme oxygenase [Tumidithrix helvetica PCC 7403]|uniref:biliverdin-producing heme oxygenase n=1 Tax=Tumidithrix helvetica TaxID=3457545 RepID=UPI003C9D516E
MSQGLATQLREGTKKSHSAAESTDFIKGFLKGVVDKTSYSKLAANLYFVYAALEAEFTRHQQHPVVGKLYYPELWREQSLEQDLAYYFGANWRDRVQPSPACQNYVQRIKEISDKEPELLAAHAYTRYMGDLSGGQILKNIAKKAMGLQGNDGTAFYEFDAIRNHGEFKKRYRASLDTLPVDQATADRIVDEANHAFHQNMDMFRELQGNWFVALLRFLWNSLWSFLTSRLSPTQAETSETPSSSNAAQSVSSAQVVTPVATQATSQ